MRLVSWDRTTNNVLDRHGLVFNQDILNLGDCIHYGGAERLHDVLRSVG